MSNRLTAEQRELWAALTNNYTYFARRDCPETLAHRIGRRLEGKGVDTVCQVLDECFGIVMRRRISKLDRIVMLRVWLWKYQLPMVPSRMSWFEKFHKTHGPMILKVNDYKDTPNTAEFKRIMKDMEFSKNG